LIWLGKKLASLETYKETKMPIKTPDEFNTTQEYVDYLEGIQAEKNAQAEAEMLAREANL